MSRVKIETIEESTKSKFYDDNYGYDRKTTYNDTTSKSEFVIVPNITLTGYFIRAMKEKYCDFTGRASRKEFWGFTMFFCLITIIASIIANNFEDTLLTYLTKLTSLVFALPRLSLSCRRLHDVNMSGLYLIPSVSIFLPFDFITSIISAKDDLITILASIIYSIVLFFIKGFKSGTKDKNDYGDPIYRKLN